MIRNLNKVYIHSRDINMRNINLNSRFGFELEGVFLDDITVGDKHGFVQIALATNLFPRRPRRKSFMNQAILFGQISAGREHHASQAQHHSANRAL
jgi:hypothetical protein